MGITIGQEDMFNGMAEEFGSLLAQKIADSARNRIGVVVAERQIGILEEKIEDLNDLVTALRADLAQATAKRDELVRENAKLREELDADDRTQES